MINDDRVAPVQGFGTLPHRAMEIFSYVLEGVLEGKDSMGNRRRRKPGQMQSMRTGHTITDSEFNPSRTEPLHLLPMWILPRRGLRPSYNKGRSKSN